MTMYSRKLKLQYLHKTTSKSRAIKIYDPVIKRDILTRLVHIGFFSIVILAALFSFNWYYVDTGQLLDLVVMQTFEDKPSSKENYLIGKEPVEKSELNNFHRVRFMSNNPILETHNNSEFKELKTFSTNEPQQFFAQVNNPVDQVSYQKLQEPELVAKIMQVSPNVLTLEQCKKYLDANFLTTGKQGNALDCYKQILLTDPNNVSAKRGLGKIEQRYGKWAKAAIAKKNFNKARGYLKRLQKVNPKSKALPKLRRLLTSSKKKSVSTQRPISNQRKLQRSTKKAVKKSSHTKRCNDIFSQESLGIRALTSKQKKFKQQHCK